MTRRHYNGLENPNAKHGFKGTRLETIIKNMVQRCHNQNNAAYHNYGGRGIEVCDEWRHNRKEFFKWAIENGYEESLTIERVDNDKGYSPDNCKWATRKEQRANVRPFKNRTSEYHGVSKHGKSGGWVAVLSKNTKSHKRYLKYCATEMEAALYREAYILKHNIKEPLNFGTI